MDKGKSAIGHLKGKLLVIDEQVDFGPTLVIPVSEADINVALRVSRVIVRSKAVFLDSGFFPRHRKVSISHKPAFFPDH